MSKRRIEASDLFRIKLVNDPDLSPDGVTVAYTVTSINEDSNSYTSEIWTVDLESSDQVRLTSGLYRDSTPRWSPDGKWLAFTSDRKPDDVAKGQIWLMPARGGEPRRLTEFENGVEDFTWSPDSASIAVVSKVQEITPDPESDVREIKTIRFRFDGEGYLDDKYRQIYAVDVASGTSTQLTSGPYEHYAPCWSPSGYQIAFAGNRDAGWELSPMRDIHIVRPDGGDIKQLTDGEGFWSNPVYSNDGSQIACLGTRNVMGDSPRTEIFTFPAGGGSPSSLTGTFDRSFSGGVIADTISYSTSKLIWSDDDATITAVYGDRGSTRLAEVDVTSGEVSPVTGSGRCVGAPCRTPGGDFIYAGNNAVIPGEIFTCAADGSQERQLTACNTKWLDEVEVATPASFEAQSHDGTPVHGWLMKPAQFDESGACPAVLEIHGGPFGMYGETFMFEFQLFAAKGFAVIYANPRGSTGYGDAFAHGLHLKWGIADMPDQMSVVDYAVDQGFIDAGRLGVLGGSYGGFMTNWMIGHTDRFQVACTQRCLTEMISAMYTDDIFFASSEQTFGGDFWDDPDIFWNLSPMKYVNDITAPLLIIHSEEDYRCPISQAEMMFNALIVRGIETEMVRFAGESHGLSRSGKPKNRLKRLEYITEWFERHIGPE